MQRRIAKDVSFYPVILRVFGTISSHLTQVVGAAREQEAIIRTRVQQGSTSDQSTMIEPNEPKIRLSAEEAKLAAMGAATAEERFNEKTPEQVRAVKERYGSQSSYQRALKIMIESGMIDGDLGDLGV